METVQKYNISRTAEMTDGHRINLEVIMSRGIGAGLSLLKDKTGNEEDICWQINV